MFVTIFSLLWTLREISPAIRVPGAPHTGITVGSVNRTTFLFHDLLTLSFQQADHLSRPISTRVGHGQAEVDIAIIELPGVHRVELLEYAMLP